VLQRPLVLAPLRGHVVRLVLRRALFLAVVGVAVGSVLALLLGQVLASVLQGVSGNEVSIYVGVPLLLLAVSALASWVPARRALSVDPVISLQAE